MKEIYFTRYDDGLLRRIEIEKQEIEDQPGWAYVRKISGSQWHFKGHRGYYETQFKLVPHSAINVMEVNDEIAKDESEEKLNKPILITDLYVANKQ